MNWQFIDRNTLRENKSGYEIHLGGGTWFHPLRLRPKAPQGMNFTHQLKLLRSGLEHIQSIGNGRSTLNKVKENDTLMAG